MIQRNRRGVCRRWRRGSTRGDQGDLFVLIAFLSFGFGLGKGKGHTGVRSCSVDELTAHFICILTDSLAVERRANSEGVRAELSAVEGLEFWNWGARGHADEVCEGCATREQEE